MTHEDLTLKERLKQRNKIINGRSKTNYEKGLTLKKSMERKNAKVRLKIAQMKFKDKETKQETLKV